MKNTAESQPRKNFPWRKAILIFLGILFGAYIVTHLKELEQIIDAFDNGSWRWLFVAMLTQVIYYWAYTAMTQRAFLTVGIKRRIKELYPLVLGALFVNVLAPTAGNSGTILFADDAKKRQESGTLAVVGYLVSIVSSYASFFVLLITAMIFLHQNHLLNRYEILGAAIFVLPTIIPPLLLLAADKKPKLIEQFLRRIQGVLNKFFELIHRPRRKDKEWASRVTKDLLFAHKTIGENKKDLAKTLGLALVAHTVNLLSLFMIFQAFSIHIHYGALLAGYVFAEVVRVISPHPEGVGAVEAIMALLFSSFGVPLISATAIAITFRALNFWAPLGLGFLVLNRLKSFKTDKNV